MYIITCPEGYGDLFVPLGLNRNVSAVLMGAGDCLKRKRLLRILAVCYTKPFKHLG